MFLIKKIELVTGDMELIKDVIDVVKGLSN